jgi:hypothetical protein
MIKNNSKHNPEAIQNMARHPRTSPIKPLNVRDNNIPTNSPLMIVPTTLPRSSSVNDAASVSCGTIDVI